MDPAPPMPVAPPWPAPRSISSSDGVTLAAYAGSAGAAGGSDASEILLAHANGFCAAVFGPLAAHLDGHRWASYDARAHGRSTRARADMSWEGHRDDVLHVIDALGLERPVGVGHSMGGAALLLAEQARPGTFAALWVFEPIVFPSRVEGPAENPMETAALRRRATFASSDEAFANYASKSPLDELAPECLSAYVTHGFEPVADGITLACRPEDEAAGYRMGVRHGAWDHLGGIRCPVVVLRGRPDGAGPAAVAPLVAEAMPLGRLEEHPELGHFGPLAEPAAMARSVLELASHRSN